MADLNFNELLTKMDAVAEAVNKFSSESVQQMAYTSLMRSMGVDVIQEKDQVPTKEPKRRPASSKLPKSSSQLAMRGSKLLVEKLDNAIIELLVGYVIERQAAFDKTAPNQAAIIAKFLKENLSIDEIDKDDIAYVYKQVGSWKLVDHGNQLENATKRNNYFVRSGNGYKLSYAGEKFAQDTARSTQKAD